jgi:hypothetical protein
LRHPAEVITSTGVSHMRSPAHGLELARLSAEGSTGGAGRYLVRVLCNATRPAGGYLSGRHRPPPKADVGVSRVRTRHKCKPCQGQGRNHVKRSMWSSVGSICAGVQPARPAHGARLVDDRRVRACEDWAAWYWRTPLGRMTITRSAVCLRRLRPRRSC